MHPAVSVAMSVYNGRRFLCEAIDSILGQTFRDFEFIIVDDGSTDGSRRVLLDYAERDDRVVLLHNEENMGLPKSLNRALHRARGEFIARFDCDDISLPARFEREVQFLKSNPDVAVVGTWMHIVDENGNLIETRRGLLHSYAHFLYSMLQRRNWLYHPSVMLRKSVIAQVGGYDETLITTQDLDLWMRFAQAGYNAKIIPEPLLLYRVHDKQVSRARRQIQISNAPRIHDRMLAAFLDDFPAAPVRHFFREDTALMQGTSFFRIWALSNALRKMLSRMRARTGMGARDYNELRRRVGQLAYDTAMSAINMSHRVASLPLFLFDVFLEPRRIFSRDGVRFSLAFTGSLSLARRLRGLIETVGKLR